MSTQFKAVTVYRWESGRKGQLESVHRYRKLAQDQLAHNRRWLEEIGKKPGREKRRVVSEEIVELEI